MPAYELYLRGNELARNLQSLVQARDLYEQSVALDPGFAPAWARLGRCHRVIGKFIENAPESESRAEDAFRRALALNPRLTIAHKLYANLEADIGQAEWAIVRLLGEATRHGNDPELFAGLVHACRYCGLFEESMTAHAEARRLDPNIATSFEETLLMMGDLDRLLAIPHPIITGGLGIQVVALGLLGRFDEARERLASIAASSGQGQVPIFLSWSAHITAWLDRRPAGMFKQLDHFRELAVFNDPEAIFQEGLLFCDVGEHVQGLEFLDRAISKGYFAAPTLARAPQFDALRADPAFQSLLADAEAGRQRALAAFREAGGDRLLGR